MLGGGDLGELAVVTSLGLLVGVLGTGLGGLMTIFSPLRTGEQQSILLGLSGGVMAAVVIWDLWPEAINFNIASAVCGGVIGLGFILLASTLSKSGGLKDTMSRFTRTGLLMGLGIGFHNLPEGLAVGTVKAVANNWREWVGLAGMMTLHNIPEGVVVAATLRMGKVKMGKILAALFLVEVPMALGALMGGILGGISPRFVAASLGFASGAMMLLVVKEMIPMGVNLSASRWTLLGLGGGVLIGRLMTLVI
jgi:ZIP family zinc transporter